MRHCRRLAQAAVCLLLYAWGAAAADKLFFIYSAAFPYQDLPRDLWPARLVCLKGMGFNTVQVARGDGGRDLLELVRLARQLGLRVWLDSGFSAPGLQGWPILDDLKGNLVSWFAPVEKRLLYPADFAPLRRALRRPANIPTFISAFDSGGAAGDDVRARPSDPSNYLLATREMLAAGVKGLNCSAVVEGRTPDREAAVNLAGELRPQAAVYSRNGALLSRMGKLLAAARPADEPAARMVLDPGQKPFPLLRLATLDPPAPRGPAFISALNYSEERAVAGSLSAIDPRTGRAVLLRGLHLPPRQALLMPVNVALAEPGICPNCSGFAPGERLVWATAELVSVEFENGVLGMEFIAPAEGELALELARKPEGPLVAGGWLRRFDWDERTHWLHLHIPAGKPPDFRSRVGLGIELPDSSVFLKTPRRLIIGSTMTVTASFSPPGLAARSRLLVPPGWRLQPEERGNEIDYHLEIPADAVAEELVTLAVESDGKIAQSAAVPLAPAWGLRVAPEEALHPRPDVRFPVRPHLATLALPGKRTYQLYVRNHCDEIRTIEIFAAGEGLRFSPARQEISVGAGLEREVRVDVAPLSQGGVQPPGLYRWNLEIRDGARKFDTPMALAVIGAGESLAYEMDLDRDGFPELILENQKLRAVFSPHNGGQAIEFLLKDKSLNAFAGRGALRAGRPLQGGITGPGTIELRSPDFTRTISLGGQDMFLEINQAGGPDEWIISTPADLERSGGKLSVQAPGAKIETEKKPFSTRLHIRFSGTARRARLSLEQIEDGGKSAGK